MNLFLFFLALLTLFIAGGLYFKAKGLKNRTIALFTTLFGFEILYFISGTTEMATVFPEIRGRFYFSIGFLYGPILLFHFQSVIKEKSKLILRDYIHFIPLLLLNIYMMDILLMNYTERVAYYRNPENFANRILYINYARSLHQTFYAIILLRLYSIYKSQINIDKKIYIGAFSIIYIITTVLISTLTVFASGWHDFKWYYIVCTLLVLIIAYILYTEPKFFQIIKAKYQNSSVSEAELQLIKSKIEKLFASDKIYLNNSLTIDLIASNLNVRKLHVSQMFTLILKESFNDYVNRHRVNYAKKLLRKSSYDQYKIEAIAQESGFNNKVTFYKAFSKFEKTTPSSFRKNE